MNDLGVTPAQPRHPPFMNDLGVTPAPCNHSPRTSAPKAPLTLLPLSPLDPPPPYRNQSKDVISQAEAVAGLAALRPMHEGVIDALAGALRRPGLFCRVRADAALALGAGASEATYMRGAQALIDYWK
jgi:hypothetical protein